MSRPDSERALEIYKTFTAQTEEVVSYLGVARRFENATRLEIPKLKHASTDLTRLLEDDLNDPDFDQRRNEYLAQKYPGRARRSSHAGTRPAASPRPASNRPQTAPKPEKPKSNPVDFFDSIEQPATQVNQMRQIQPPQFQQFQQFQQFPPQQTGFQPQQTGTNPFGQPQLQPLQPTPTGAGFGGYTPQPQPQPQPQQQYGFQNNLGPVPQQPTQPLQPLQPQHTNPFRQSMMMTGSMPQQPLQPQPTAAQLNRQSTNPFARRMSTVNPPTGFQPQPSQPQATGLATQPTGLQPQRTGTNPFARRSTMSATSPGLQPLRPNPTGSTNPFRQSQFVNQQTGQGWQTAPQGSMGGYEQLDTVPVFPRPGLI